MSRNGEEKSVGTFEKKTSPNLYLIFQVATAKHFGSQSDQVVHLSGRHDEHPGESSPRSSTSDYSNLRGSDRQWEESRTTRIRTDDRC